MFRNRAAWINSRPGVRWRSAGSVPLPGDWISFKYQGGYYIGLAVKSGNSYIYWSTNLITWNSVGLSGTATDIACDGTYFFCTTDSVFGAAGVHRITIANPASQFGYNITAGLVTKTIDWSPGVGKFIIGAAGKVVYNTDAAGTTWSAPVSLYSSSYVPVQGAQTDAGVYALVAEDTTPLLGGIQLFTINSSLSSNGVTVVQTNYEFNTPGIVPIPGARAPLYVYKKTRHSTQTTQLITEGRTIFAPPTPPLPAAGFENVVTIPYTTENLVGIFNSPTAGNVYIIFESGQVWESLDYGVSWNQTFTVTAGTRLAASGPLGIAILQSSGQLLVSP